jgi:hypothetical protein
MLCWTANIGSCSVLMSASKLNNFSFVNMHLLLKAEYMKYPFYDIVLFLETVFKCCTSV